MTDPAQPPLAIAVRRAAGADRAALGRMLELYQHDLSDIWDQDLDAEGCYGYGLARFFAGDEAAAYIATANGHLAGFALVDRATKVAAGGHWMDQFFVLKKYRRAGVGSALAVAVFDARPGAWEVGQMPANAPARAFWHRLIGTYTGGRYTEHRLESGWWQGTIQCFSSPGAAGPA